MLRKKQAVHDQVLNKRCSGSGSQGSVLSCVQLFCDPMGFLAPPHSRLLIHGQPSSHKRAEEWAREFGETRGTRETFLAQVLATLGKRPGCPALWRDGPEHGGARSLMKACCGPERPLQPQDQILGHPFPKALKCMENAGLISNEEGIPPPPTLLPHLSVGWWRK